MAKTPSHSPHFLSRESTWERVKATFDEWPQIGTTSDGSLIRRHREWGDGVREPSGFICTPIAYSVRNPEKETRRG